MGPRLIHDPDGLNTGIWPVGCEDPVTPVDLFFTRSHAAVPRIDPRTFRLEVGGLVHQPASFSLEELTRTFPRRQVTATLVCAGLRRNEFLRLGSLPGELPWGPEPASTGCWAGLGLGPGQGRRRRAGDPPARRIHVNARVTSCPEDGYQGTRERVT